MNIETCFFIISTSFLKISIEIKLIMNIENRWNKVQRSARITILKNNEKIRIDKRLKKLEIKPLLIRILFIHISQYKKTVPMIDIETI